MYTCPRIVHHDDVVAFCLNDLPISIALPYRIYLYSANIHREKARTDRGLPLL